MTAPLQFSLSRAAIQSLGLNGAPGAYWCAEVGAAALVLAFGVSLSVLTHQTVVVGAFLLTICVAGLSGGSDWLDGLEMPGTLRAATLQTMANLNMDRTAPVILRIYKEEKVLEIWNAAEAISYLQIFRNDRSEDSRWRSPTARRVLRDYAGADEFAVA